MGPGSTRSNPLGFSAPSPKIAIVTGVSNSKVDTMEGTSKGTELGLDEMVGCALGKSGGISEGTKLVSVAG